MHNQKKGNNKFKNKKNNQNCQKIELYGSPTTKELKKHSSRQVGRAETGSGAERMRGEVAAGGPGWARWWLVVPHLRVDKMGGITGQ